MKFLLLLSILAIFEFAHADFEDGDDLIEDLSSNEEDISKRSVFQFAYLINKYTSYSALDYNGYGCWCGKGGKGSPLDGTDRCCWAHDMCYNRLIRKKYCGRNEVYARNYYIWGMRCHTGWGTSRCGRGLCRCDVDAVKCFQRNQFNKKYKNYNKSRC